MNRPARDLLSALTQPHGDLFCGTVGERDGTDALRVHTARDEMLDPRDEAVGLARTRAGDDEYRAEGRFDCATLLGEGR